MDWTKLKADSDNESGVAEIMISVCDKIENIVEKEKILIESAFSHFPQCSQMVIKRQNCVVKG